MKTALLIPIYCPNEHVLPFLSEFSKGEFDAFLVVDDGSGEKYAPIFQQIRESGLFEVVSYPKNKGKGAALKTGIAHLLESNPNIDGIVTADGDGQHSHKDVLRVKEALAEHPTSLIMGTRDFSLPNVPAKSRKGNRFSSWYYHVFSHKTLNDTQTGLRGIPHNLFEMSLESKGSRYEYEMNFLLDATAETEVRPVMIDTIYENNNATSHFRPFRDSCRIFSTPIIYFFIAVGSCILDLLCFYLFQEFLFPVASYNWALSTLYSMMLSRAISGPVNFLLNWFFVFPSKGSKLRKTRRYLTLFVVTLALSYGLTCLFEFLSGLMYPWAVTIIKLFVDLCIAIANFMVNALWVFAKSKKAKKD